MLNNKDSASITSLRLFKKVTTPKTVNKGQRIQIAQALIRIAPEVTAKDRAACAKKLNISKVTICYYLNGKVTNNDKALRVLEFLQNKITYRQQAIEGVLCKSK